MYTMPAGSAKWLLIKFNLRYTLGIIDIAISQVEESNRPVQTLTAE